MRLSVTAEPQDRFNAWKQQQLADSRTPTSDLEKRGQQVFVSSTCILCHTIAGTDAAATVAPDLSHLASRGTIAAGTLANTPANLASWILAPQRLKPGAQMPATTLPPDDLVALVTYLASLR
jgi:cytochrome c oxidase subunit II